MDDDNVLVQVKVPVSVSVLAPRWLAEDSDADDLREIVDQVIQKERKLTIEWKSTPIQCTVMAHWDRLPEDEMETMSTESGSWGE